ncbi:MAG: cache domain-containing protein [Gemmataceae bacterium]
MYTLIAFVCLVFASSLQFAAAGAFGTKPEAVAMVARVQAMFAKSGPAATFAAINDRSNREFHDRDLYPFVYDLQGVNVAHGARPVLVGKNLISLKDQDGNYVIQRIIAIAEGPGHGWVSYKWPNPITNRIEDKISYIEKMGDYVVGVGVKNTGAPLR